MSTSKTKKMLRAIFAIVLLLVFMLGIHIYYVTKDRIPTSSVIAMARIDIKQDIDAKDASTITDWLYKQKGVTQVLVNPTTKIAVFTFYPSVVNADTIAKNFVTALHYPSQRFKPTEQQLQSGCPAGYTSSSSSITKYFKFLF